MKAPDESGVKKYFSENAKVAQTMDVIAY